MSAFEIGRATSVTGASLSEYVLASQANAGATQIVLDRSVSGILAGGSYIAVGSLTSKCEIRRITTIAGATLTLDVALVYAHAASEFAWVLDGTLVPAEWFGLKANDSTFDSGPGLQHAFNDWAVSGGHWGITGHQSRYHVRQPLCCHDNMMLDRIVISTSIPYSIDCTLGLGYTGVPSQFQLMLSGQFGTVSSVNTTTNEIVLSSSAGGLVGERLVFYPAQGATLPAPLEAGRHYFMKTFSGTTYTVSVDYNGTAVDLTTSGSGTIYFYSPGAARTRWDFVTIEGGVQAQNGFLAFLQQPAVMRSLRIDSFQGEEGGAVFSGQQAEIFSSMFNDCTVGLNLQGMQFLYVFGSNFEQCDIGVKVSGRNMYGESYSSRDVQIFGAHWEQIGVETWRYQTVYTGSGAVTAGTYTLTFRGDTTTAIAYNASAATVQAALEALPDIDPGDVIVTDISGGLPSGSLQIHFVGQYLGLNMSWYSYGITVSSTGLTGGTYSKHYAHPDAAGINLTGGALGFGVYGGVWTGGGRDEGNSFLRVSAADPQGYAIQNLSSIAETGYVVYDPLRSFFLEWTDADQDGVSGNLGWLTAQAHHGSNPHKSWFVVGSSNGRHAVWEAFSGELRINGTNAKLRFGDTGPMMQAGTGSPNGAITAPVGSLFLRTDGGAATSLYVKETGTGNTGWVGK